MHTGDKKEPSFTIGYIITSGKDMGHLMVSLRFHVQNTFGQT